MTMLRDFNKDSLNFFSKNFVHDKFFAVDHTFDAKPKSVKNDFSYSHKGEFAYGVKHEIDYEHIKGEMKVQNSGLNFSIKSPIPSFPKMLCGIGGKHFHTSKNKLDDLEVFTEISDQKIFGKLQLFPAKNRFLLHTTVTNYQFGTVKAGMEVSGCFKTFQPLYSLGAAYEKALEENFFSMSLVASPSTTTSSTGLRFNFFGLNTLTKTTISTNLNLDLGNTSLAGEIGGKYLFGEEGSTDFCAKINHEGNVAVSCKQEINSQCSATVGMQVDPKKIPNNSAISYGLKLSLLS